MSRPVHAVIYKIGIVLILLTSHLYCVAAGVYEWPPFGVLQQAKRLLTGEKRDINYAPYYFQRVSFFDLIKSESRSRIVMLGDSITNGCEWSELLSRNDVVNRGISGDTTDGILTRIDQIISLRPQKVFLMIGINDLYKEIPVSKILSNYQDIITKLRAENIEVLVQSTLNVKKNVTQRNLQVNELNRGLRTYCRDHGIRFIDLNRILAPDGFLLDKYSNDVVHLMGEGYAKWKDAIVPFLP
jgi:hypothetical protein